VAGTVLEVGAEVTRFSVGDEVFGIGTATFAEYAAARADRLALKPASTTFAEAAVVPVSGLTALQALGELGALEPGQRVLVLGASGGVGSFAIQLARSMGAEVTAVCSSAKADFVRSLGAHHVVDYDVTDVTDVTDADMRYDLILDLAGSSGIQALRRALTPDGTAVLVGGEQSGRVTGGVARRLHAALVDRLTSQRFVTMRRQERSADLEELARLITDGSLTPALGQVYPLERVANAMGDLAAGRISGKAAISASRHKPMAS
jgi:NADPH:quinone reductase-like Zn-dependent oxidoreductase